jgi:hypothetical protein
VVAAGQEGRDRGVVELAPVVALPVAAQPPGAMRLSSMVCSSKYDSCWTRSATGGGALFRRATSSFRPWSGSPTQTYPTLASGRSHSAAGSNDQGPVVPTQAVRVACGGASTSSSRQRRSGPAAWPGW